ncbi:MAG TPA: hypothetical protein VEW93_02610 [Acidimicrobiales bacterium]|nr:hypothetical protein [Acidimicrobiales bacterium]
MPAPSLSRLRWRRARREVAARRGHLAGGGAVELPCRARRTTARGWGEWVGGRLRLPGPEGGGADFVADDPHEVALVTRRGEAPVRLEPPLEVAVRGVRYRAEAFHGPEAEIITVTSPRRVVEIALPPGEVESTARRLAALTPGG